ncbi:hypothetical protein [Microbacterium sp. P02]|uniref:hypothetical protein n=1 Tax=Microbacterium sp. P02 TaxID=3366260 RepID=UPI00366D0539
MRVELHDVVKGRRGAALPATSLAFDDSGPRIAHAETEQRPTVLGLIASGRMKPDAGRVLIDGTDDRRALRRRVSLVDAPDVSDPAPNVWVSGVTAEELMFAGRPAHPLAVRRWLDEAGFGALWRTPIADVEPRERISLLLELTALRAGVDGIVLVAPDRHGGDPLEWWRLAEDFSGRGFAMLVIAGEASATVLDGRALRAEHGARDAADPRERADAAVSPGGVAPGEPDAGSADGADIEIPLADTPEPAAEPEPEQAPAPAPASAPEPEPAPEPEQAPAPAPEPAPAPAAEPAPQQYTHPEEGAR